MSKASVGETIIQLGDFESARVGMEAASSKIVVMYQPRANVSQQGVSRSRIGVDLGSVPKSLMLEVIAALWLAQLVIQ